MFGSIVICECEAVVICEVEKQQGRQTETIEYQERQRAKVTYKKYKWNAVSIDKFPM